MVYTVGTYEPYRSPGTMLILDEMTKRGFVAATVEYPNESHTGGCGRREGEASCIYSRTPAGASALDELCALPTVDCARGVVTSGLSQGGEVAVLAKNYAPEVRATFAMSIGDYNSVSGMSLPCLDKANTQIPSDRLMVINGASDPAFGSLATIEAVTGYSCDGAECWSDSGSGAGWIRVQDAWVADGWADHCWFAYGGCLPWLLKSTDPGWAPPASNNWSLAPTLDWLASLGTHRVFSASGQ
jgi:hypothetical protein